MASFSATATNGANMAQLWPGTSGHAVQAVVTATASQFRITMNAGAGLTYDIVYIGSGFTYSGTVATGGTYHQIILRPTGGTSSFGSISSLSQPLADIYTVSLAAPAPLSGNDTINGNSIATSSDVLFGGAGNDRISDIGGVSRNIDAGAGDDSIFVGSNATSGSVNGGSGTDVLNGQNISGVAITGVEVLDTLNQRITGRATQFDGFDTIRANAASPTGLVSLQLAATGAATSADLSDELNGAGGPRALNLIGSADSETITSGNGNDSLGGGAGNDVLFAGIGNDRLSGEDGNDILLGGDGEDWLTGGLGNDTTYGGAGNDLFFSGEGHVVDFGDAGDDRFNAGINNTGTMNGGAGIDTLNAFANANVSGLTITDIEIFQTNAGAQARAAQYAGFHTIIGYVTLAPSGTATTLNLTAQFGGAVPRDAFVFGSSDSETLVTGAAKDYVQGNAGNDNISAGAGNDSLSGGQGDDTLNGEAGDDLIGGGVGANRISGGAGNDIVEIELGSSGIFAGDAGDDRFNIARFDITQTGNRVSGTIDGGSGDDTLHLEQVDDASIYSLGGLTLRGIETARVDTVLTVRATTLEGVGSITFDPFFIAPSLRLVLESSGRATTFDLADEMGSTRSLGIDVTGSRDNETIFGLNRIEGIAVGGDSIEGGGGADKIDGRSGDDTLSGDGGKDTVKGGAGFDMLNGGTGRDVLTGGANGDSFVFDTRGLSKNRDTITDFRAGADQIQLQNTGAGLFNALASDVLDNAAFKVIGPGGGRVDASDRILYNRATGELFYDADGRASGTKAVHFATLSNRATIDADDIFVI